MGSLFSTKQKTKTNQTQTNTATTTPNVPTWASTPYQDFLTNNVSGLAQQVNQNPQQFIPGANSLQQQAYTGASNLGGWQGLNNTASQLALAGATGGANLGNLSTYQAPQLGNANQGTASLFNGVNLGQANTATAPQLGQANTYQAALANATGLSPTAGSASASLAGPAQQATASNAAGLVGDFRNAGLNDYVSSVTADAQAQADRVRQAQAAQAAGAGAFGGSRYGVREATTEGELARAQNAATSGARFQAENAAIQAALAQAGLNTGTSQFNAGEANQLSGLNAQLGTQTSIANAGNQTQAGIAGSNLAGQLAMFNAGAQNDAGRYGADAANQFALQQGQFDYGTGLANMDALNNFALQQGGFNQQAGLANQQAQNQYGLANMDAANQFALSQAGLDANAGQFNAGAANQMSQFNAGQGDNALARLLSGAGIMGQLGSDYGNQSRADVGAQLEAGNSQYGIDAAQALAPFTLNQGLAGMFNQFPIGNFTGQTINSNGTLQGTNVQTSTPSPFNIGMSLASLFPSDSAFKADISPAGRENGFNLYNYRYKWDEPSAPLRTGVMADEIEDVRPDAVAIINGMRYVDYGALGLSHLVEG